MWVYPRKEIRMMDAQAQEYGIEGTILMEHAALALYEAIARITQGRVLTIAVICGHGNNGGDGLALARLLERLPHHVSVYMPPIEKNLSDDTRKQKQIVMKMGIVINEKLPNSQTFDIIVDCLLGTGLNRPVEGVTADMIAWINAQKAYVIACDIPSGLHGDTGKIMGTCVKADETITFAAGKSGLYLNQGIEVCGKVHIVDIHIPEAILRRHQGTKIIDDVLFRSLLPKRKRHSHKGTYGKVLMIGGRTGMSGALLLAAQAALRCGLGTLSVMCDQISAEAMAIVAPEAMYVSFPKHRNSNDFQALLKKYDCIAIGNGLGRDDTAAWIVEQVYQSDRPCLFDGDALYLLRKTPKDRQRTAPAVYTPHPKEVSYLLGTKLSEMKQTPSERFYELEKRYPKSTFVLKDTTTWIFEGNKSYINVIGNDGLAKGGSGDVLCGMICGFMAQRKVLLPAAILGVYLHAACAEKLRSNSTAYSILPQDLISILPATLYDIID